MPDIKEISCTEGIEGFHIRDVWAHNLEEEFALIRDVAEYYNYVAMDTEFPGVVVRPVGNFRSSSDYQYQSLRANVDMLKIIQLGLTFTDEKGLIPTSAACTWQFHFQFDLSCDIHNEDSIELLKKAGLDFGRHAKEGIDVNDFGELLMTSGLVLNDQIKWTSFHSYYDFGYLLKVLTCKPLPEEEEEFFEYLRAFFPCIYDVKYMMRNIDTLHGGLNKVAETLCLERIGPSHQAGSDSLLTAATFFKMRQLYFEDSVDDAKYMGVLYGLGQGGQQQAQVPWD